MDSLGNRLKLFININFSSNEEFAEKIKCSPTIVSNWITNKKLPGSKFLLQIYKLGLSIDWLLSGDGAMLANNDAGKLLKGYNIIKETDIVDNNITEQYVSIKSAETIGSNLDSMSVEQKYELLQEILGADTIEVLAAAGRLSQNRKK